MVGTAKSVKSFVLRNGNSGSSQDQHDMKKRRKTSPIIVLMRSSVYVIDGTKCMTSQLQIWLMTLDVLFCLPGMSQQFYMAMMSALERIQVGKVFFFAFDVEYKHI
ncbi:hypothetical protein ACQJBY_023235 [Aegilops geniculata]